MHPTLVIAGLALLVAGLPAHAEPHVIARAAECNGKPATIVDLDGGHVVGTDGDDVIVVDTPPDRSSPTIRARTGDDTICLSGQTIDDGYGTSVNGGPGTDVLLVRTSDAQDRIWISNIEELDADLAAGGAKGDKLDLSGDVGGGAVSTDSGGLLVLHGKGKVVMRRGIATVDAHPDGLVVEGFSRVRAYAPRVTLVGGKAPERLLGEACDLLLSGGRGADRLQANPPPSSGSFTCDQRSSTLLGGRGDDRLIGGLPDDVLIGGPGRDGAAGHGGVDRCVAEWERGCER